MRMRTGQLPTKIDDAQDPHSPTLCTSHRGCAIIRWLSHKAPQQKQTILYKLYKCLFKTVQKYKDPNTNV